MELDNRVWSNGDMRPEVREKLLAIADEFMEWSKLGVEPERVLLVGSMAGHNYTPRSDLDLHIVVDLTEVDDDRSVARMLVDALKALWNSTMGDVRVRGRVVEVYVQGADEALASRAVYDLTIGRWVKRQPAGYGASDEALEERDAVLADWSERALAAIDADSVAGVEEAIDLIYAERAAAMGGNGELDPRNLAFKRVRDSGLLDALKERARKNRAEALSLEKTGR